MCNRALGYCATASICGSEIANELADLAMPTGLDLDHVGDQCACTHRACERDAQETKCRHCDHQSSCA